MKRIALFLVMITIILFVVVFLTIPASAETYSGNCGPNMTWTLDTETGLLTITGSGQMNDYPSWYQYCKSIKTVIISSGVTSIGDFAFKECTSLTSLTMPDSILCIDTRAFQNCSSLINLVLGSGVTTIGSEAFYGCSSLTSIIIPDGVQSIGRAAFVSCSALTSITIPDSVTSINTEALFYLCSSLKNVVLPNSITSIDGSCFAGCHVLTSVTIPESVTSIGRCAFSSCYALKNMTIPEKVSSIGDTAFGACSSLINMTVLNPNCEIYDSQYTLGDKNITVIHGKTDSTAQVYALKFGYNIAQHTWLETSSTATCTLPGTSDYVCTICGDTKTEDTPAGHIWCEPTYEWNENNNTVTATRICQRDNSHFETETVDVTSEVSMPASCLEAGYTTYTAIFVNPAFKMQWRTVADIPPLGHDIVHYSAQAPTCIDVGWEDYDACSRCNYTTCVYLSPLGHELISHEAQTPTCTEIGWYAYETCARCDYSSYYEIRALGHSYQNGICSRCGVSDPFYSDALLTVSTISVYAKPGATIIIPVDISGSAKLAGFTFSITTDEGLTLVNVEKGALLAAAGGTLTKNLAQGVVNWTNVTETYAYGELLLLTLKVEESAELGAGLAVRLRLLDDKPTNIANEAGEAVSTRFVDSKVVVLPVLIGDTNTDDDVNSADAVRLVRSLVLLETLTDDQRLAADVSHDDDVTSADSILLTRYLAGFEDRLDLVPDGRKRGTEQNTQTVTLSGGSVTGQSGMTVTLPVTLKGNPGFAGFTLHVDYPESLEFLGAGIGDVLATSDSGALLINAEKNLVNWNDYQNTGGNGLLLTLSFRIKEEAVNGTYEVGLSLRDGKAGNFVNEHGEPISANFNTGKVTVQNVLPHFVDVPNGAFYQSAVEWAVAHGITSGTSTTRFSPNATCTRSQVVTFLWRAKGCPVPAMTENPFSDVKTGAYYYDAVMWAVENGVTSGTSKTTFGPNNSCTRGQVVTFLWRAEGEPKPSSTSNPFTDVKQGQYYYDAVLWAVANQITSGPSKTTFGPNQNCTRGQIVTFLYRAYAYEKTQNAAPAVFATAGAEFCVYSGGTIPSCVG